MLSIVIPVYNEASTIRVLLDELLERSKSNGNMEIIIVDGGSTDTTPEKVTNFASSHDELSIRLLRSEKGRARQMNAGAAAASGNILYFLHADSIPPVEFDSQIREAVHAGSPAGCFRLKFDKKHPLLQFSQWFTRFNHKACRGGDQSLFVKRSIFEAMDGYDESFQVYEDCEFINRLYDNYSFTVLNDHVLTSARKYNKNGTYRLQYHFAVIHLKKWTGASPDALSRYYTKNILS